MRSASSRSIYNIGAIFGGVPVRHALREVRAAADASSSRRCSRLPVMPLWAFAGSARWLAIGAFLMQVMVQGAWGVVPVHLNELSPDNARGTFPGFVYQLGNLIASVNAPLQAALAAHWGGNYALLWRRGGHCRGRDRGADRRRHRGQGCCFRQNGGNGACGDRYRSQLKRSRAGG